MHKGETSYRNHDFIPATEICVIRSKVLAKAISPLQFSSIVFICRKHTYLSLVFIDKLLLLEYHYI